MRGRMHMVDVPVGVCERHSSVIPHFPVLVSRRSDCFLDDKTSWVQGPDGRNPAKTASAAEKCRRYRDVSSALERDECECGWRQGGRERSPVTTSTVALSTFDLKSCPEPI